MANKKVAARGLQLCFVNNVWERLPFEKSNVMFVPIVLLAALSVAAHELINATSGVYELRLTSVEGVRS